MEADVIVVGGGPAGSSCAWRLRAAGLDAVVLDAATFPRDKVCAGWITPGVVDALDLDLVAYRRGRVLQPVTRFRTGIIGGPALETDYGRTVSYGILRCEFDAYLLHRSGARLRTGRPVRNIERREGVWVVNDVRAPLLVGAGGHFCPVARHLGARRDGEPLVVAQEVEFQLRPGEGRALAVRADTPELYFCADLKGYGWCFRKEDRLNVGLGRLDRHGLATQVTAFRDFLAGQGRVPDSLPARWKGHAYLLYERRRPRVVDDGVLLVGDAAGLAYPASGEGIRPAVESGLLAAEIVLAARGRYGRERLEPYRRELQARFGEGGGAAPVPLPAAVLAAAGRGLFRTKWFTRRVVLDRWFLRAGMPPLSAPSPAAAREASRRASAS